MAKANRRAELAARRAELDARAAVSKAAFKAALDRGDAWVAKDDALDRIIAAVGGDLTSKVDRTRLADHLQDAWGRWLLFSALDSEKATRARKKLFDAIVDTGRNFRESLLDERGDRYAARQIASTFSEPSGFDAFLAALDHSIKTAEIAARDNSKGGWVRLARSPKEWFAAEILAPIYKRNFGRPAKVSRTAESGTVGGPFIRFAVAVMQEMRISISAETVARALKDVRARRDRRQRRATTLSRPKGW
jgi:hypothetical protein